MWNKQIAASRVIDAIGGTSAVARVCGIAPASVSDWRHNGIPPARMSFLRLAFPDLPWKKLAGTTPLTAEEVRERKRPPKAQGAAA